MLEFPYGNMSNKYRIFFHQGDDLGIKTHVLKGHAWIEDGNLNIKGPTDGIVIAGTDVLKVELFRLYGLSRVIRVDYRGGRLYLAVVRFMIGQFASVNFFATGKLHGMLADLLK